MDKGERLRKLKLEKNDEDVVICAAFNPAGEDSLNFTLQVLGIVTYW